MTGIEILATQEAPECYIQQCKYCGAVLKYSERDINPANFTYKTSEGWGVCIYDSFKCPFCHVRNEAKRRWMIE